MSKRFDMLLDNDLRIGLMNLRTLMAMTRDKPIRAELKALYSHMMFHGIMIESMERGVDVLNALVLHSAYIVDLINTTKPEGLYGESLHMFENVKSRAIALSRTESEIYMEVAEE